LLDWRETKQQGVYLKVVVGEKGVCSSRQPDYLVCHSH
jgi:hypothetical protein